MPHPFVSIIILNYNGAHYLPACLDALKGQTYPADSFEVIVSDNSSKDGSLELLYAKYPWVQVEANGKNLGFASGNNVAIKRAHGKYIVLLNNDTAATPAWLEEMVAVAEGDPKIGMVTGHLQLFYPQLEVELATETFMPEGDDRVLGILIYSVDSGTPRGVVQYLEGFYGREVQPPFGNFRWMEEHARLGVPVPSGNGDWQLTLKLAAPRPDNRQVSLKIMVQGTNLADLVLTGSDLQTVNVHMPAATRHAARPVEQNTGSLIFKSGAGRDRGTYVRNFEAFYETDTGRYDVEEEVFSGCGASLLLRRAMLDQVGVLDDHFFMYYEDTDLSWRARLAGWKVVYAPKAIVPHVHCGTTTEWSHNFMFLIERNRLAMVFKNGPTRQMKHVWGGYFLDVLHSGNTLIKALLTRQTNWRDLEERMCIHLRVLVNLAIWVPSLLRERFLIQRTAKVNSSSTEKWFVEEE